MSAVATIMTKNPKSVGPTTSVVSAAKTMKSARVGSLFVKKGKQLVGIVTDTDIVRRAVSSGKPLGRLTVEKIMTAPIRTIDAGNTVDDAQDMMGDHSIRHLGVTKNGEIIGVVSVRDLQESGPPHRGKLFVFQQTNNACRRGDPIGACIQVAEFQLPHRQHAQSFAAEHADIDLAAVDILLGDRVGADLLVNEGDALGELFVIVHQRGLGDTERGVLAETLDDQRESQGSRRMSPTATREDRERRYPDPVVGHKFFRQRFPARQHQPPRVAARIAYL